MHESPITLAVSIMALLTGASSLLVAIFKRGRKEGMDQSTVNSLTYQIGTVKSQGDSHQISLAEVSGFMARQGIINEHQGDINRIREERENKCNERISRLEGRMEG